MHDPRELYRQERERRRPESEKALSAVEAANQRARALFLDRLSLLQQGQSYREFAKTIGVSSHTSVEGWFKGEDSFPKLHQLRAIAQNATIEGVPKGKISLDWLCGMSDEPNREARTEVGDLPRALANHVAMEVGRALPRTGFWRVFAHDWKIDGRAIIADAVRRCVDSFNDASVGLDDLEAAQRELVDEAVQRTLPPFWPKRGESTEERQARRLEEQKSRRSLVTNILRRLMLAEFRRRVDASGAPHQRTVVE